MISGGDTVGPIDDKVGSTEMMGEGAEDQRWQWGTAEGEV